MQNLTVGRRSFLDMLDDGSRVWEQETNVEEAFEDARGEFGGLPGQECLN